MRLKKTLVERLKMLFKTDKTRFGVLNEPNNTNKKPVSSLSQCNVCTHVRVTVKYIKHFKNIIDKHLDI